MGRQRHEKVVLSIFDETKSRCRSMVLVRRHRVKRLDTGSSYHACAMTTGLIVRFFLTRRQKVGLRHDTMTELFIKACPHQATNCCQKNGSIEHLSKSPFLATNCCRFRQQFVAVSLLPGVDRL